LELTLSARQIAAAKHPEHDKIVAGKKKLFLGEKKLARWKNKNKNLIFIVFRS
jgi:hypothetical protein